MRGYLSCLVVLSSFGLFASSAMTNLVDAAAVWDCFAAYTNNTLRIEAVDRDEWSPARRLDRLPFDMPYQLLVGPDTVDRVVAEAALTTVVTSMPTHLRAYYAKYHLMAPLQQWLIRRSKSGLKDAAQYVAAATHPNVWLAKDFDLARLAAAAKCLTSNSVPMLANLAPIYGEYKPSPITRAEPLVDYPDPRPEETYATPFGVAIVLRAMEGKRKFRFHAAGWPFNDRNVNFKWVPKTGGVSVSPVQGQWEKLSPAKGYGEIVLDWNGAVRRDVLVFARYGQDPWGPPSVISFYRVPNERRLYDRNGRLQSVEYLSVSDLIPQLYQNKPWKDVFMQNSLGALFGFLRTRAGQMKEEPFSLTGEHVLEFYAGDVPKETAKVRYFTRPDDPTTLDYEVTKETVQHPNKPVAPRNRGEGVSK